MVLTQSQHQQIHVYLLVLFCFFFPLIPRIAVLAIVLLVINGLWSGSLWRRRKQAFSFWPSLFSSFYLLHLLGMLYTENVGEGLLDLETKLSFLLLPPLFFALPIQETKDRNLVLQSFLLGCTVMTVYSYACATLLFFRTGLNGFFYEYLSGYVNSHPSYLAIYLIFCLFLILRNLAQKKGQLSMGAIALNGALFIHFLGFIFLLTARMQLIVCLFLLGIVWIGYTISQGKLLKGLIGWVGIITLLGTIMWNVPTTKARLLNAYQQFTDPQVAPNIRIPIWRVSTELIKSAPLIGYGTGDVQDNLMLMYRRDNIERALKSGYNCHNQFLQTSIALGSIGLLILLACWLSPLFFAMRDQHYIYAFFLGLIILSAITECIIETQRGILFYTVFNSFFASKYLDYFRIKKKTGAL